MNSSPRTSRHALFAHRVFPWTQRITRRAHSILSACSLLPPSTSLIRPPDWEQYYWRVRHLAMHLWCVFPFSSSTRPGREQTSLAGTSQPGYDLQRKVRGFYCCTGRTSSAPPARPVPLLPSPDSAAVLCAREAAASTPLLLCRHAHNGAAPFSCTRRKPRSAIHTACARCTANIRKLEASIQHVAVAFRVHAFVRLDLASPALALVIGTLRKHETRPHLLREHAVHETRTACILRWNASQQVFPEPPPLACRTRRASDEFAACCACTARMRWGEHLGAVADPLPARLSMIYLSYSN
jgi:hypothetical protein